MSNKSKPFRIYSCRFARFVRYKTTRIKTSFATFDEGFVVIKQLWDNYPNVQWCLLDFSDGQGKIVALNMTDLGVEQHIVQDGAKNV